MKNKKITIIGAGLSGLVAAKVLEEHGYSPLIIEASDRSGGRVKTDMIEGFALDRGFQVLLTAYPSAQKHLNFKKLNLQFLKPGAVILSNKKQKVLGDPSRDFSLLMPTLFSNVGSFLDKLRILKLSSSLKKKTIAAIFSGHDQSTASYLLHYGFSEGIINNFFNPFFSGIFLETKMHTSSRMFEFIFKMFAEGQAAIPKGGMEAIPKQIYNGLQHSDFIFNTKVISVNEKEILLDDNRVIQSDYTILANAANGLINKENEQNWKCCDNLYFTTKNRIIKNKLIGLVNEKSSLINNLFYHSSLESDQNSNRDLLSVTVINNRNLEEAKLVDQVIQELSDHCGIEDVSFLKSYRIVKALPVLSNVIYSHKSIIPHCNGKVFVAGDQQLNPSLNGAMLSGEQAAKAVLTDINNR